MPRLSAFLITRNEAGDLPGCLESLKGLVDEIVVVDDRSQDQTLSIAKRCGARTFSRALDGFAAQKQFALDQTTGEWALSIDADERVTPALAEEIRAALAAPCDMAGYQIRRRFYFLGRLLRRGGLGRDWVLRLFRRPRGRFAPARVHERVEVDGPVGRLQSPLDHFSYATLDEYVEKCNRYTSLAAQDLWHRGRRFSWADYLRPGWEILSRLLLRGAWLDGHAGILYAALSAHAAWLRAVKLWEIENKQDVASSPSCDF